MPLFWFSWVHTLADAIVASAATDWLMLFLVCDWPAVFALFLPSRTQLIIIFESRFFKDCSNLPVIFILEIFMRKE